MLQTLAGGVQGFTTAAHIEERNFPRESILPLSWYRPDSGDRPGGLDSSPQHFSGHCVPCATCPGAGGQRTNLIHKVRQVTDSLGRGGHSGALHTPVQTINTFKSPDNQIKWKNQELIPYKYLMCTQYTKTCSKMAHQSTY